MHAPGALRRNIEFVFDETVGLLQSVTISAETRKARCERDVAQHLAQRTPHELPGLCADAGFSGEACAHGLAVVFAEPMHGPADPAVAVPACRALLSTADAEEASAAAMQRRGVALAGVESLETSLSRKRGQPDYLVRSAGQTAPPAPPPYVDLPPIPATDLTIAQPPDADGNPYNEPTWGENAPAPEPPAVEEGSLLQMAPPLPSSDARAVQCERDVAQHFAQQTPHELPGFCADAGFSVEACAHGLAVVFAEPMHGPMHGPADPALAVRACRALLSTADAEAASAAAMQRRGVVLAGMGSLETSLSRKRGQPDYLVRSAGQTAPPAPPPYVDLPPIPATDLTIAQPPDADGNPYNEPTWGENAPAPEPPAVEES